MKVDSHIEVVLYTRAGCHLCEEAQKVLGEFNLAPKLVDIDDDKALLARFDSCVPVVEINGRVRFRGRVEPRLLRRIIRRRE